jgi:membrane carboxypeptidase/penicillin-binding protein
MWSGHAVGGVGGAGGQPVWSPTNVEGQAAGTLRIGEATIRSVNCAYAIPGRPVAGKTGSTDENADAWLVGFTPSS